MKKLLSCIICAILPLISMMAQEETMSKALSQYRYAENNKYDDNVKGYYLQAATLLEKAVDEGYGEAAYLLGDILQAGKAGVRDQEKAFKLYNKSIELGYEAKDVELRLGDICATWENDATLDGKNSMAFKYYSKGYTRGHSDAGYRLALCYYQGLGVEKDKNKAFSLCRNFLINKGYGYKAGREYKERYVVYLYIYSMLADFCMDKAYELQANGFRVSKNKDRIQTACELLFNAQSNRLLLRATRIMYNNQTVVSYGYDYYKYLVTAIKEGLEDEDLKYAYYIYADYDETAAETGEYAGEDYVVDSYGEYTGLSKVTALTNSAELGYIPAMKLLGDWYEKGHFVSKNLVKAKYWHDKAAAANTTIEQKEKMDSIAANSPIFKAVSDIQCPAALIMTNNGDVNVRQQPNAKAKKIGSLSRDLVYGVIEEQNGWYKVNYYGLDDNTGLETIKTGWVSGTVTHKTENNPITADMQNSAYGYVDYQDPDAMDDETYMNRVYIRPDGVCVAWVGSSFEGSLYLGRYIDNVCCMKYRANCSMEQYSDEIGISSDMRLIVKDSNKATGMWIDNQSGWRRFIYGSNYAIKLKEKDYFFVSAMDLSLLDSDTLLMYFFAEKIKNNETYPIYISSTLLSGKYMSNH